MNPVYFVSRGKQKINNCNEIVCHRSNPLPRCLRKSNKRQYSLGLPHSLNQHVVFPAVIQGVHLFLFCQKSSPGAEMNMETPARVSPSRLPAAALRVQQTGNSFAEHTMTLWMENGTWSHYVLLQSLHGSRQCPLMVLKSGCKLRPLHALMIVKYTWVAGSCHYDKGHIKFTLPMSKSAELNLVSDQKKKKTGWFYWLMQEIHNKNNLSGFFLQPIHVIFSLKWQYPWLSLWNAVLCNVFFWVPCMS